MNIKYFYGRLSLVSACLFYASISYTGFLVNAANAETVVQHKQQTHKAVLIRVGTQRADDHSLAGCWNWSNGAYITIDADGTAHNGPFGATWVAVDTHDGRYTITWPSFVDTLTLSADGSALGGTNNFGFPVSAARKSGAATGVVGTWLWSSGVTMTVFPDSTISGGTFRGNWVKAGDKWVFEWPLVDKVFLDADGHHLSLKNQFGSATAKRAPDCKGV
ncbi:MAG TPA: hypothetical protein ENI64_02215 [Gammaproteobacteria bacterium]|nr:hypothetical protein [Gammaproteobacteria bacterium]